MDNWTDVQLEGLTDRWTDWQTDGQRTTSDHYCSTWAQLRWARNLSAECVIRSNTVCLIVKLPLSEFGFYRRHFKCFVATLYLPLYMICYRKDVNCNSYTYHVGIVWFPAKICLVCICFCIKEFTDFTGWQSPAAKQTFIHKLNFVNKFKPKLLLWSPGPKNQCVSTTLVGNCLESCHNFFFLRNICMTQR